VGEYPCMELNSLRNGDNGLVMLKRASALKAEISANFANLENGHIARPSVGPMVCHCQPLYIQYL
jgi:hypothetical protein